MGIFKALSNLTAKSNELAGQAEFQKIYSSLSKAEVIADGQFHKRNFWRGKAKEFKAVNLTKKLALSSLRSFVAFDVETTGIPLSGTAVIELSAVRFDDFQPTELFTTLINPQMPIPSEASAINHIYNYMVKKAPVFHQIIPSFEQFIGERPLAAHNAEFDVSHLYVNGLDCIVNKKVFDTCSISRKLCKGLLNHKLATSCANYNIYFNGAHRASADALACGMLFVQELMQYYSCKSVQELQQAANDK